MGEGKARNADVDLRDFISFVLSQCLTQWLCLQCLASGVEGSAGAVTSGLNRGAVRLPEPYFYLERTGRKYFKISKEKHENKQKAKCEVYIFKPGAQTVHFQVAVASQRRAVTVICC